MNVIEHNYTAVLYESRNRIARAASRATFMRSLGAIEMVTPPAPLGSRVRRPLLATVELKHTRAGVSAIEGNRAA